MSNEEKKIVKYLIKRISEKNKVRNKITIITITFITILFIISFSVGTGLLQIIKENSFNIESVTVSGISLLLIIKLVTGFLIMFIAYLIIFNVYNVSLEKDVQFYGSLKLVGATRKQILNILFSQFYMIAAIGIIFGVIISLVLSSFIIPKIIMKFIPLFKIELNIKTYIDAIIFSFASSSISMLGPVIKVAQIPPVKSVKFSADFPKEDRLYKRGKSGGKIHIMAWRNLFRKNQKSFFTILCISIAITCLHSSFILVEGLSSEKYVEAKISSDFVIGTSRYFYEGWSFSGIMNIDKELSEISLRNDVINNIKKLDGIENEGAIYLNADFPRNYKEVVKVALKKSKFPKLTDPDLKYKLDDQTDDNGNYYVDLYGADDFPLSNLKLIDGKLNLDKLKTGKYIVYAVPSLDLGNPKSDYDKNSDYFNVGDTVTLLINNKEYKYEIIAKVVLRGRTGIRFGNDRQFNFYLPSNEFLEKIDKHILMSYLINTKTSNITSMEKKIKEKSELENNNFKYQSKEVLSEEFFIQKNTLILLYVFPGVIFAIIGTLNFVNSVISSILASSNEIAILKSVGMTLNQVNRMVCFEGIYFTLLTGVASFILIVFGDLILGGVYAKATWYYAYKFNIYQILPIYPILLILSILIRKTAYRYVWKKDLVQELKR